MKHEVHLQLIVDCNMKSKSTL